MVFFFNESRKRVEMDLERRKILLTCLAIIIKRKKDKGLKKLRKRKVWVNTVSYTHLRAHETRGNLVCRLLLEKKKVWVKEIFRQREQEGAFTLTVQRLKL